MDAVQKWRNELRIKKLMKVMEKRAFEAMLEKYRE